MHISLSAEKIFTLFGVLPVTNTLLMSWLAITVLIVFAFVVRQGLKPVPQGVMQNAAEAVIDGAVSFIEEAVGSRRDAERFFPIVGTIFFFVLLSNWMGILPGVGSLGFHEAGEHGDVFVPLFRSVNSDINMTLALAASSVIIVHVVGVATIGFFKHAGKYLNFKNPILLFVGILELVGEVAKMVSFSFRLFGNIFAGEVLLTVIAFLVPYIAPLPFLGLEIFVGFMQALVFSMLTLVFLKIATEEHH
ncbi:MAG: F0F1 ATP synthase subunit A [bacterium]|nr:F0F1 ATP synthase subunit A [bacterium]